MSLNPYWMGLKWPRGSGHLPHTEWCWKMQEKSVSNLFEDYNSSQSGSKITLFRLIWLVLPLFMPLWPPSKGSNVPMRVWALAPDTPKAEKGKKGQWSTSLKALEGPKVEQKSLILLFWLFFFNFFMPLGPHWRGLEGPRGSGHLPHIWLRWKKAKKVNFQPI